MYSIDVALFHFFNRTISGSVLDTVMIAVTEPRNWAPVLILLAFWLHRRYGWRGIAVLAAALLLAAMTDAAVHRMLKPLFGRIRPCNALEGVAIPAGGSSGLSFPSAHATNSFAIAVFLSAHVRRLAPSALAAAAIVAVSRVYLGLHYPSDVLAGALLGGVVALLAARLMPFPKPLRRRDSGEGERETGNG